MAERALRIHKLGRRPFKGLVVFAALVVLAASAAMHASRRADPW